MTKHVAMYFLLFKGLTNDDVGMARTLHFKEYGRELVPTPVISSKEKLWGLRSVERLWAGGLDLPVNIACVHEKTVECASQGELNWEGNATSKKSPQTALYKTLQPLETTNSAADRDST